MAWLSKNEARAVFRDYKEFRGEDEMGVRGYLFAISCFIVYGIALAALVARGVTYDMEPNIWWFVAYFAAAIPGIIISAVSQHWAKSLFGYTLVIVATGAIVGPFIKLFEMGSVLNVFYLTIAMTVAIGAVGALWPRSVEYWFGYLFAGLIVLILADLSTPFLMWLGVTPIFEQATVDWFAIGLFSFLIFFDMNQAVRMPWNLNNAVYNAVAMYLNMINLFVRLLARTGQLASDAAPAVGETLGDAAGSLGDIG